jgi:SNF2 family DNA or RNA helicase
MLTRDRLRPGQCRVVDALKVSAGVQVVLGMGGGKTAAALTAIADLLAEGSIRGALVLAPKRVAETVWPTEPQKWEHLREAIRLVGVFGPPAKRRTALEQPGNVYVVGLENVIWLLDELRDLQRRCPERYEVLTDLLVIDELSKLKSPRGVMSKALRKATKTMFRSVWGLTGTPRPNDWQDIWAPMQIISGGEAFTGGFDDWLRTHFLPETDYAPGGRTFCRWTVRSEAVPVLEHAVADWSVVVPPEAEADVAFLAGPEFDRVLEPTAEQRRALADLEREALVHLREHAPDARSFEDIEEDILFANSSAHAVGLMSQVCQGFVYRELSRGRHIAEYIGSRNPKYDTLVDMLEELSGDPPVVVYQYRKDLEAIERACKTVFGEGLYWLGGNTETRARDAIILWNERKLPMLAIHPASAGHGLNLQFGGRRLIWYAMTWSPEQYVQTIKRLARPGQTAPVYSHRLLIDHRLEHVRVRKVDNLVAAQKHFISSLFNYNQKELRRD